MNALESHWSRGRWLWAFLFLFIAHVAAVFWLAQRPHSPARWPAREPFFTFADDGTLSPASLELARLRDPTLFALPSEHGFSGNAWLKFTPPPPLTNNWTEAPRWLPLPIEELGSTFAQYVATNRPSEERLIEELPEISLAEVRVPAAVISTGSTFKVEGPLASRRLANSISLPSAVTNIVLQRTELDVTVNAEGQLESAVVAVGCEMKEMNEKALELVRALRFEPVPGLSLRARELAPPTLGRILFTWHVVRPEATNSAGPISQ